MNNQPNKAKLFSLKYFFSEIFTYIVYRQIIYRLLGKCAVLYVNIIRV